jgi:hypothetical protein
MSPFVVCAANRKENRIICGARHYDPIMRAQINASEGADWWKGCEQGFIDQFGRFYTREEALVVAKTNGQIKRRVGGDDKELFSESLY